MVGSGVVVLPARTHTVNYGSRNNKRVRVRGDLQGAVGGGGWRREARERKEGGETNPTTDEAMAGDGGGAGGGEEKRRRRRARACAREAAPGGVGGGVEWGTDPKAPGGPFYLVSLTRKEKKNEIETVRGWTPFRKSVRIFGPFFGGLLKRSSLLHTNSDWSDFRAYG